MKTKIGILLENRFIDQEIIYYQHRFPEAGYEVDFLTRLWGQPSLEFTGLELEMKITVNKSFTELSADSWQDYGALIVPAGYVADYLLYAEEARELSPAVKLLQEIMADKSIIKGFICHALWLAGPLPEVFSGRKVTCHNNIISHVENMGADYINQDIVVDDDLVTARDGGLFAEFAGEIIEQVEKK